MMRGRSPGALSFEYPATFPPSNRLIHFTTCLVPSLHGRLRLTFPQFSLYPGGGFFEWSLCVEVVAGDTRPLKVVEGLFK